eukprot:COSAG02_NODE_9947_length_2068_cov_1.325038_2_plen_235_part_00
MRCVRSTWYRSACACVRASRWAASRESTSMRTGMRTTPAAWTQGTSAATLVSPAASSRLTAEYRRWAPAASHRGCRLTRPRQPPPALLEWVAQRRLLLVAQCTACDGPQDATTGAWLSPPHYVSSGCGSATAGTLTTQTVLTQCSTPSSTQFVSTRCIPGSPDAPGTDTQFTDCSQPNSTQITTIPCFSGSVAECTTNFPSANDRCIAQLKPPPSTHTHTHTHTHTQLIFRVRC